MSKLALGAALGLVGLGIGIFELRERRLSSPRSIAASPTTPSDPPHPPLLRGGEEEPPRHWQPLFNGVNLNGWEHLGGGQVSVQDGVLVLEHDAERRPGYLVSRVSARDFEARFQCRIEDGDSGFFFRSRHHPRTPTEVAGPQVQLNAEADGGLGGIFELHGRGWVRRPEFELSGAPANGHEWLDCRVFARGERIAVTINGRTIVDFKDDGGDNDFGGQGLFALQIHGGGYCRVLFREIAVRILD